MSGASCSDVLFSFRKTPAVAPAGVLWYAKNSLPCLFLPIGQDVMEKQSVPEATGTGKEDGPMPEQQFSTCDIMGVHVAVTDMEAALRLLQQNLDLWRGEYICVANVHTTVTAHRDPDYLRVQNGSIMVLPDGGPLSKYSRAHGYPQAQRVTGPDLMRRVLAASAEHGWTHYFYGSTPETLEKLRAVLAQRYPGAKIAGMYSPPFRALTPEEDAEDVARINAAAPDFVWVGLGAPKQERWMAAHKGRVHALMLGVGAAFDYEAGNIQRAPDWMQRHNLEWFYRLMQDPGRLFGRYLSTNLRFLAWAARQKK